MTSDSATPGPLISRRRLLEGAAFAAGAVALGGLAAACGAAGKSTSPSSAAGSPAPAGSSGAGAPSGGNAALDFTVWTYAVDTVASNIANWESANPGNKVTLTDYPWDHYHETMVQRLSSATPTDVLYNNGSWLAEFAKAGWVVPIEGYLDFEKYRPQIAPYALQGITYQGKAYGLPYYADIASFMWNPTVAKQYGVDKAPETWDELMTMAKSMKAKGLAQPIMWEFSSTDPSSLDEFIAMCMSRGSDVFDNNMSPLLEDPNSPAFLHAQFMADTVQGGLAATLPTENEAVKAMQTGQHVFTVMYNYNLAAMNNKGTSPLAGQFQLAMMPGSSHATLGYVRMYGLAKMAVDRGADVTKAAANFIEYMGGAPNGQYVVAKRWAVERGLGFGILPLFDDPDVIKAFSTWVDVGLLRDQEKLAQVKREAPWTGQWGETMLLQLSKAVAGQSSVADAMKAAADKARALKVQFG